MTQSNQITESFTCDRSSLRALQERFTRTVGVQHTRASEHGIPGGHGMATPGLFTGDHFYHYTLPASLLLWLVLVLIVGAWWSGG
jgi:hypothetical protein